MTDWLFVSIQMETYIKRNWEKNYIEQTSELDMIEFVGNFTGRKVGVAFFRGKDPMDGVWAAPDLAITGACVMPVGYGIRDWRPQAVCNRHPYLFTNRMQPSKDCESGGQEA